MKSPNRRLSQFLLVLAPLLLGGCGTNSSFLRAMNDATVAMGGENSCHYEASGGHSTMNGKGYSLTYGGECNDWEGRLNNYGSKYTIRCESEGDNGINFRTISAAPGEDTGWRTLAPMGQTGGGLSMACAEWARTPYNVADNDTHFSQMKRSSGRDYLRVRNRTDETLHCGWVLQDKSRRSLSRTLPGEATDWLLLPKNSKANIGCDYEEFW